MPLRNLIAIITVGSIAIFCISCKSDTKESLTSTELKDLIGEWQIVSAKRNGNDTKSLEKGKFYFTDDTTISSNLFATENSLNFQLENEQVLIEGDPNIKFLKIERRSNDSMSVSSKMSMFDLEFLLVKE